MGFLDYFSKPSKTPSVSSLLPSAAIHEIEQGRLPILRTKKLFLNFGEDCHYIDNAIYQKEKKVRISNRSHGGIRVPGPFRGTTLYSGNGQTVSREQSEYEQITGILAITNQRIIFTATGEGVVYPLIKVTALTPYTNAVEIQVENAVLTFFVPDGNVVANVLHILR